MNGTTRAKRWGLCAAAAVAMSALTPIAPASAGTQSTFLDVLSGGGISGGATALATVSTDGGATFRSATVVTPLPEWAAPAQGAWISSDADRGTSSAGTTTVFRQEFRVGPGPVSSDLEVCVHAADTVVVRLNGTQIGAQPTTPVEANSQAPEECFDVPFANLRGGGNELEFRVSNEAGEMGLWFRLAGAVVVDTDAPPVLVLPDDILVEDAGPEGAVVHYNASAIYSLPSGWPLPQCDPPSGSTFPLGITTVTCIATNPVSGATATGWFDVTVRAPNQPPTLQLPADIVVTATSPDGAYVEYTGLSAGDDGTSIDLDCTAWSGRIFPIGVTTVTCTATDDHGLTTTGSFTITVNPVATTPTYLVRLGTAIADGRNIRADVRTLLAAKHATVVDNFAAGRKAAGCRVLKEMDGIVVRYRGAGIPVGKATNLRNLIKASRAEARC
jgi:hypothetical protein